MIYQESEGFLSPVLKRIRLKKAASLIEENSIVLDLACGNGYLYDFLPPGCQYYGVDRIKPKSKKFTAFLNVDLLNEDAFHSINHWLPVKPDYITCIAFLEHIKKSIDFIKSCTSLLGETGIIIGTTPVPSGHNLHHFFANLGLCSQQAADEHETFLDHDNLNTIAENSNCSLSVPVR